MDHFDESFWWLLIIAMVAIMSAILAVGYFSFQMGKLSQKKKTKTESTAKIDVEKYKNRIYVYPTKNGKTDYTRPTKIDWYGWTKNEET